MTQIKDDNGNWVVVAGGQRTWVGTKAALQTALNNDEIPNGTPIMVTDDYAEGTEIVDVVENGNMKAVTSNAVYDAIAPIGDSRFGNFSAFSTTGQHDTNLTLPEGTWLVLMTLLTGPDLSGDMYMTAGGTKVSGYIRADNTNQKSILLTCTVTINAGDTKVIGLYQANGIANVNGDGNFWYVNAYRLK